MPVGHGEVEARLKAISAKIDASEDWLSLLEDLKQEDYYFIGDFIQTYCVADLNSRQLINSFKEIIYGKEADFTAGLNDTAVLVELENLANAWPFDPQIKDGVIKAVATLKMHLQRRHEMAHWVYMRIKNIDAFFFFTKNTKEGRRRTGGVHGVDEMTWGACMAQDLKAELVKLKGHCNYLAHLRKHLYENKDKFKVLASELICNKTGQAAQP
jgi:hypothetical protein